ncbi:MAG: hypothetical protein ACXU82_06300 [Caulobacteraceae bacterium]
MRTILILAALAMATATVAPSVQAQTLDKNGRCHDAAGKFAKAEVCKGSKGTTTAAAGVTRAPADPNGPYKLDAKGKCHDVKGKMAAKAKCAA